MLNYSETCTKYSERGIQRQSQMAADASKRERGTVTCRLRLTRTAQAQRWVSNAACRLGSASSLIQLTRTETIDSN